MRVKIYTAKRPLLETLIGYIEASRCRTLDTFLAEENANA
jgi:hypothetical protein